MEEMFTRSGNESFGPAFVYLDIPDENGDGKQRGIGFHGSTENEMRDTDACIRLYNDDMLLIREKLKVGLKVSII